MLVLNLFFDEKFDQLIKDLGIYEMRAAFRIEDLIDIRENAKGLLFGKPREAAARAFHNLILLNTSIPIQTRLDACFAHLHRLKLWHFEDEINVDLHLGIKASFEKLLLEYVGAEYFATYEGALSEFGVIVPIQGDDLHTSSLAYMYRGKKEDVSAKNGALSFCVDIVQPNAEKYRGFVAPNGLAIPELVRPPEVENLERMAEEGGATEQFMLAVAYEEGYGVPKDHKKAAQWFHKAAMQGFPGALWNLGFLYCHGVGVSQDHVEAFKWWTLALQRGVADAKKNLEVLQAVLTPDQIEEARKRVDAWEPIPTAGKA